VSARQLEHPGLGDDVARALESSGLDPAALTLELTETVLARDPASTSTRLAALRDLGVRIAVDDFGTGYSSLSYLRQFPVDALKIDRSFVSALGGSEEAHALVRTLVRLGADLGLEVIAEGIEDEAQLELLRSEGCDTGQGYLLARPLAPGALAELLGAPSRPQPTAAGPVPVAAEPEARRRGELVGSASARAKSAGRGEQ
jgi:EAL domain-containing protein (putative c-di-GMP-specific phosphodiesterase class I)